MHSPSISNLVLHEKLTSLAREERKLTLTLLHHLREAESRQLFAERGHGSLFDYVVKELHYSESSAQRRISAMRALRELPEFESKVESGELKVTQLAQVQTFLRAEKKEGKVYSKEAKRKLLSETLGKSTRETEKILVEKNSSFALKEKARMIAPHLTQVTFTADEEFMSDLEKVRNRFAHQLPVGASFADILKWMTSRVLSEKSVISKPSKGGAVTAPAGPMPAPVVRSRYVPSAVRRKVWERDGGRCTFVSSVNGKKCESRHRLEVDHKIPFALGGLSTSADGLRLLCWTHNQLEARRVFGTHCVRRCPDLSNPRSA